MHPHLIKLEATTGLLYLHNKPIHHRGPMTAHGKIQIASSILMGFPEMVYGACVIEAESIDGRHA